MKQEIKLKSRGNIDNRLIQLEENSSKYKLKTNFDYRVGFEDDNINKYSFIDPAGGPSLVKPNKSG